jgi:hypothetical protein
MCRICDNKYTPVAPSGALEDMAAVWRREKEEEDDDSLRGAAD